MVIYTHTTSGATVFSTGTFYWSHALVDSNTTCASPTSTSCIVDRITRNFMSHALQNP